MLCVTSALVLLWYNNKRRFNRCASESNPAAYRSNTYTMPCARCCRGSALIKLCLIPSFRRWHPRRSISLLLVDHVDPAFQCEDVVAVCALRQEAEGRAEE